MKQDLVVNRFGVLLAVLLQSSCGPEETQATPPPNPCAGITCPPVFKLENGVFGLKEIVKPNSIFPFGVTGSTDHKIVINGSSIELSYSVDGTEITEHWSY